MSKFFESLTANKQDKAHPNYWMDLKDLTLGSGDMGLRRDFLISAQFRRVVTADERDIGKILDNFRRELHRDVYGEFEGLLFELELAVDSYDREKAREVIGDIKKIVRRD